MMRAHRGKQLDWTKPFKLIQSKSVFEELDADSNELIINTNYKTESNGVVSPINKKQQIIIPKIEVVRRITQPKKFAKIEPNYIRLTQDLNLPKLQSYQLNEVDHVFLQGHANKFKLNGKIILTPDFLSKAFIELEKKAGKDPSLPRNKSWFTNYIEKQCKELMNINNYQQFTEVFYNYWKNRRQELKFPMLRQLWHPNPDEYNHLLAFKIREKQKRNLRRNNRLPEDEIAQQMQQQFLLATKLAERLKFRQQLKLKQVQHQLITFHNKCKQFFTFVNFIGQYDTIQLRQKDKQKLKKLQNDVDNVKKLQNQEEEENKNQNINVVTYDQKQSIAEFLSKVINVAQNFGITYQRIYNDKIQKQAITPPLPIQDQQSIIDQKHDYMLIKLCRDKNTIYRYFKNIENQQNQNTIQNFIKLPKDIFEFKAKQLQYYYYGSDDEGDAKDLKKNISTSYKKFQVNRNSLDF